MQISQTAAGGSFRELLKTEDPEQIRFKIGAAFITAFEAVGVRPAAYPSEIGKKLITDFVLRNYPYFNDTDILNAFIFAIEGKYGHPDPETKTGLLELYDKPVSINWIAPVLKAYSQFRTDQLKEISRVTEAEQTNPVTEHLKTRPLNNQAVKDILIKVFSDVSEDIVNTAFLLPEFYGFLEDNGLIELDTAEKADITAIAEKQLNEEKKDKNVSGGGFLKLVLTPDTITDRAKKLAIIVMFEKFKTAGVNEYALISLFERVCYLSPKAHKKLFTAQQELKNRQ